MAKQALVVTTVRHAVVFGYADFPEYIPSEICLERARMCIYWSAATHGVLGLASIGPQTGSRVGPPVPTLRINAVTSIMLATASAAEQWEKEPWSI